MTKRRWAWLLALGVLGAGLALLASQLGLGIGQPPVPSAPQAATPPSERPRPEGSAVPSAAQSQPPEKQQMPPETELRPRAPQREEREQLRREIAILKLLAEMDLTPEQLEGLQSLVADLAKKRDAIVQAQLELRDFLLGYQGDGQTLEEALRPYEEKVEGARKDFRDGLQAAVDRLKEVLTLRQGEILQQFLLEHFAVPRKQEEDVHVWLFPRPRRFPLPKEGKLEIRIEGCRGPRPDPDPAFEGCIRGWEERFEALGERLEDLLQSWDWDIRLQIDWDEILKEKLKALKERKPGQGPRTEGKAERPWVRLPGARGWACGPMNALLQRFLAENLDLLNRLLTEKLNRMGSTQL